MRGLARASIALASEPWQRRHRLWRSGWTAEPAFAEFGFSRASRIDPICVVKPRVTVVGVQCWIRPIENALADLGGSGRSHARCLFAQVGKPGSDDGHGALAAFQPACFLPGQPLRPQACGLVAMRAQLSLELRPRHLLFVADGLCACLLRFVHRPPPAQVRWDDSLTASSHPRVVPGDMLNGALKQLSSRRSTVRGYGVARDMPCCASARAHRSASATGAPPRAAASASCRVVNTNCSPSAAVTPCRSMSERR